MVFSSILFLCYFLPAILVLYYVCPRPLKNTLLLLASVLFYAWGAPKIIFFVLGGIVADYALAFLIHNLKGYKRHAAFVVALILNIGLLAYYKYANFFVDNLNPALNALGFNTLQIAKIALPIGISFFTFQKMSYVIDVYRGVKAPMKYITDYALYVLFFPQLIAGPILRFNEIAAQITDRRINENADYRLTGFFRFVTGLAKKVLIANVLGAEADRIFAMDYHSMGTAVAWTGILAYTFQIYFDFAGYSDMAIGMARMFGFVFPENFNNPYTSRNITEFWRRWHMTLSTWMRDYLYIPLGGNRGGKIRLYINLWIVFIISGLWHGASWNFVVWGCFHGFFLVADRLFLLNFLAKIGKYPSIVITFLITIIGWAFFRIENMNDVFTFLSRLVSFSPAHPDFYITLKVGTIMAVAFLFSFITAFKPGAWLEKQFYAMRYTMQGYYVMFFISFILLVLSMAAIASGDYNPFIYFRF